MISLAGWVGYWLLACALGQAQESTGLPAAPDNEVELVTTPVQDEPPLSLGMEEWKTYTFENVDDQDFDRQPDEWNRRYGADFPRYVPAEIDRQIGHNSRQSLRFDLLGGMAVYYSPLLRVDDQHSYTVRGHIRTSELVHNAGLISVSLLNHKRQRIQRFVSRPISGSSTDWQEVRLPTISPSSEVRFLVLGVHVIHSQKMDVRGQVWFDDLWIGRSPRMSLRTNPPEALIPTGKSIQVELEALGVDRPELNQMQIRLRDHLGTLLREEELALSAPTNGDAPPKVLQWPLGKLPPGYYVVDARLIQKGETLLDESRSFVVVDPPPRLLSGDFGWSLENGLGQVPPQQLTSTLTNSGIHWLKIPLWSLADPRYESRAVEYSELIDHLGRAGITTVGLLSDPPEALLRKFAYNLEGISKLFLMPSETWYQSIEPVIARFSFHVRYWQLGRETDNSFERIGELPEVLSRVKREFDRMGHDVHLGIHWDWDRPLPSDPQLPPLFASWHGKSTMNSAEIRGHLQHKPARPVPRWIRLTPLSARTADVHTRAADLALRMLAARIGQADKIMLSDPFDAQTGVLHPDGTPTELFLPWRTIALTLNDKAYQGELPLEQGSQNAILGRNHNFVMLVWNDRAVTERLYLGDTTVEMVDLWGRRTVVPTEPKTGAHLVPVSKVPVILRKLDAPLIRFQLAMRFEKGSIRSEYGAHPEALLGHNTFDQGINGTVKIHFPKDWKVEPSHWPLQLGAQEQFRLPMELRFPQLGTLGEVTTQIECELSSKRLYKFTLYRPYELGTGDVTLDVVERYAADGHLEIEQRITNTTNEVMSFQCGLIIPGQRRQRYIATKIGKGTDYRQYNIWNVDATRGQELRIRAEQIDGRRVLNFAWKAGQRVSTDPADNQQRAATADEEVTDESGGL